MAKILRLDKKRNKFLCFVLDFSYLWLRRTYFALGNEKKNELFFCISLIFSYLCTPNRIDKLKKAKWRSIYIY